METPKLPACTILIDKCNLLNPEEYYATSFGPEHTFTIEKKKDNSLVLKVWDCYHVFGYQQREVINLKDAGSLVQFLVFKPIYYAMNHFSKQMIHMDNWINLIEAFKLRTYKKDDKYVR